MKIFRIIFLLFMWSVLLLSLLKLIFGTHLFPEKETKNKSKETIILLPRITYQSSGIFLIENSWHISTELADFMKKNQGILEIISLTPLNVDSEKIIGTDTIPLDMDYQSNDSVDIRVERGESYLLICKLISHKGYIKKGGFWFLNPTKDFLLDTIISKDSIKIY